MPANTAEHIVAELESDEAEPFDTVRAVVGRAIGEPTEPQLELIRAQFVAPEYLDENPVFVFQAEVSNNTLDAYYTRMDPSSLQNFAEDAKAGISFMNSHRTGGMLTDAEQPYGRSFDAVMVGSGGRGNSKQRVDEWFYIPRSATPNGPGAAGTEDIIRSILTGTGRDISIGFYGGEFRCSICEKNMARDWSCWHLPGMEYAVKDKDGKDTDQTALAVAWIHGARQAEASSVYDGATPGCMVKKARRMADAGELKRDMVAVLEQRYRVRIPYRSAPAPGVTLERTASEEEHGMTDEERRAAEQAEREQAERDRQTAINDGLAGVRSVLSGRGITEASPMADIELTVRSLIEENTRQGNRLAELDTDATRQAIQDGRDFRESLFTEAMEEGVRAYGDQFNRSTYEALLANASIPHLRAVIADWKRVAGEKIPTGRSTTEAPERTETDTRKNGRDVSDRAYKV